MPFLNKIKNQITVIFIIIVVLSIAILGVLSTSKTAKILENQIKQDNLRLIIEAKNIYLEKSFNKLEHDLTVLSQNINIVKFHTQKSYREKLFYEWQNYRELNPYIDFVYLGTKDNKLLVNPEYTLPKGYKTTSRPWFITGMNNKNKISWTKPYKEAKSKILRISLVKYIEGKNGYAPGVISIDVSFIELQKILDKLIGNKKMQVLILSKENDILVSTKNIFNIDNEKIYNLNILLSNNEGNSLLKKINNEKYFISYTTININGWKLVEIVPMGEINQKVMPIKRITIFVAFISLILAIILGYFLSQIYIIKPLLKIINQTEEISKGNLDIEISVKGPYEFKVLEYSINKMRLTIKNKINSLKTAANTAEKYARTKSEFLATISHEIRTPLNGIMGFTHIMKNQKDLSQKQLQYLNKIQKQIEILLKIINDTLYISKIDANKMEIEKIDTNLEEIIIEIFELFEKPAYEKNLDLIFRIDPEIPSNLPGDPLKIRQILINLINNAIKFTEKGYIFLDVKLLKRSQNNTFHIDFSLTDTGIGMTEEQQKKVFSPFMQAESSISRKFGGTGLGLAITKELVELLGGKIKLMSKKGEGTIFYFNLPFKLNKENNSIYPLSYYNLKIGFIKNINKIFNKNKFQIFIAYNNMITFEVLNYYFNNIFIKIDNLQNNFIPKIMGASVNIFLEKINKNDIQNIKNINFSKEKFDFSKPSILFINCNSKFKKEILEILKNFKINKNFNTKIVFLCPVFIYNEIKNYDILKYIDLTLTYPFTFNSLINGLNILFNQSTNIKILKNDKPNYLNYFKNSKNKNILLIDDNEINLEIGKELLVSFGLKIDCVNSGNGALEKISTINISKNEKPYSLILLDIELPDINGLDLAKKIRKFEKFKTIPIIAMTAHANLQIDKLQKEFEIDNYVVKPFSPDELFNILKNHIDNSSQNNKSNINRTKNKNNKNIINNINSKNSKNSKDIINTKNKKNAANSKNGKNIINVENKKNDTNSKNRTNSLNNKNSNNIESKFPELSKIKGLDIEKGLKNIAYKKELLIKLLKRYCNFHKNTENKIKNLITQNKYDELYFLIHSIKGAAGNIGLIELSKAAEKLEPHIKNGNINKNQKAFKNFMKKLENFISNLEYLNNLNKDSLK